jgi:hypothetical protein
LTLDESWFYLPRDNERIWLTLEQPVPDRERDVTESPELMLTIAWNPSRAHVVAAFSKGLKSNAGYYTYTTKILERIKNWWKGPGAGSARKWNVHADNARHHTAKLSMDFMDANRMTRVLHPPCSPDLTPSDFFLFGNVKRQLSGCFFDHADDRLTSVEEILNGLTPLR